MYVQANTRSESNEENKVFFKPYGTTCTFKFKIRTLYCVCALYVRMCSVYSYSDYFPLQHSPRGLSNESELCSL